MIDPEYTVTWWVAFFFVMRSLLNQLRLACVLVAEVFDAWNEKWHQISPSLFLVCLFLFIFLTDAWFCTKPPIKHNQPLLVFFVQYCSCSLHGGHWMSLQVINMNLVFNTVVQLTWVLMIWHSNYRFAAGKWHVPIKGWKYWWAKMTKELFWSIYFIEIHVAACGL